MDDAGGRDDSDPLDQKKREFLDSFFRKGAAFTHDLLRENDRMRRRIVSLEQQIATTQSAPPSQQTLDELVEKIHALETERRTLHERFSEIDSLESRLGERYEEIERENNDLASLYVAKSQLHSSLDLAHVVQVIVEILLNFCGASRFALLLFDERGQLLPLASEGLSMADVPQCVPGAGRLGESIASRHPVVADCIEQPEQPEQPAGSVAGAHLVSIPLCCNDDVIGVIVVWAFLPQKRELWEVDRRIFRLLCESAGVAIEAARLSTAAQQAGEVFMKGRFEQYAALLH